MQSRHPNRGMWAQALQMLDEAERLQRQFFRHGTPGWEPPVDIYEAGRELLLYYALPGVRAERLKVVLEGNALVVRGDRSLPPAARQAAIRRLEIPYGPFERRLSLPAGHYELVQNELDNGCLIIGLRRVD